VLLVYKVVTIVLIYTAASATASAGFLLLATNWLWLIVLGIFLSVLPIALWFRLLRARSRRAQLRRSEWDVSWDSPSALPSCPPDTRPRPGGA
jgi:hypothetical protein